MLAGTASFGSAAVIGPISGNECAGQGGFSNCELTIGGKATPAVIKFNSNIVVSDVSTGFPSVTGDEFGFFDIVTSPGEVEVTSFTYTLGADDPCITGFAVFAARDYLLYDSSRFPPFVKDAARSINVVAGLVPAVPPFIGFGILVVHPCSCVLPPCRLVSPGAKA